MDDLRVSGDVVIPAAELNWRFDPSGGPGGQHANKSATRVELVFDVASSAALDDAVRQRVLARLENRVSDGAIVIQVAETRSQWRNRQIARRRLADLLAEAMRPPAPRRRRTQPSRAVHEKRLAAKRARAETKKLRRSPEAD